MSTWNMYSDSGGNLRWEESDSIPQIKPNFDIPNSSSSSLSSMNDLLFQGCSNVKENRNGRMNNSTIFKTGLGKPVPLNQSSISRAVSVIGQNAEDGCSNFNNNCNEEGKHSTMFCTGFGKPVALNQSSGSRTALLLGDNTAVNSSGEKHAIDKGCGFLDSLFQTGSGKRVNISPDGLLRAKTLLGFEDDIINCGIQNLQHSKEVHNTNETYERQCSRYLTGIKNYETMDTLSCPSPSSMYNISSIGRTNAAKNDSEINIVQSERYSSAHQQAPIKFHTAGGRSIFVSNDALQRAKNLLGEPDLGGFLNEGDGDNSIFACPDDRQTDISASGKRSDPNDPLFHHLSPGGKHKTKGSSFSSLSCNQTELSTKFTGVCTGNNLIKKFDAVGNDSNCEKSSITFQHSPLHDRKNLSDTTLCHTPSSGFSSRTPFADVSNTRNKHMSTIQPAIEKRRPGNCITVSPFKRPRRTNFSTPLMRDVAVIPSGLSKSSSNSSGCKRKVSSRYPFHYQRMSMREFFEVPPLEKEMLEHFPDQIRQMTSADAQMHIFNDGSGINGMGAQAFFQALPQYGASACFASKEWVANHYKWIVWKLALYEQCYPSRSAGKFLTVSNVLEELKYRYEREVNHGHRSVIKRILEGDAPSSSMMILSISAIHSDSGLETGTSSETLSGAQSTGAVKVELTDKWYSITAILDVPLSKQLAAGRLSVGQKLRIWGARLSGWNGPVSPLEVTSSVSLLLHMNGTYRAHWAERLGFCKNPGPPLAFRCIKRNGGLVPQTLAGITRVYPILYKESLSCGAFVVRSERMENKMMELYNQRRSAVVEGIVSEFQKERNGSHNDDSDSEGAKIYQMLETTEEPEFLMADMSPEQLMTFSAYKSKLEAKRQSEMEKSIEKALQDAGLRNREVTPFMRVRVVGLTRKICQEKSWQKEGLITIWNPTEKQKEELVEGMAYAIAGLTPSGSDSDILHLQARGSYTKWLPLSSNASKQFKPFFNPRESIPLSSLSDIPISGEFDIAAFVVHVGDVYTSGQQKKQWVFVTDGSVSGLQSNDLLAISFCSPSKDCDSFEPINYNLMGSTVGFCNLIKKAQDQKNHTWVAEASEISTYYLNFDSLQCSHLRDAATSTRRWANISTLSINKTREKVLSIIGD